MDSLPSSADPMGGVFVLLAVISFLAFMASLSAANRRANRSRWLNLAGLSIAVTVAFVSASITFAAAHGSLLAR